MKRIVLLIGIVSIAALPAPAHAAFPGRNGPIAYVWNGRYRSGATREYQGAIRLVAATDSTPVTVLGCSAPVPAPLGASCNPPAYADPAFSPSGKRIVFDAGRTLAIVNLDGSDVRLLPGRSLDDGEPAFSPSGTQVAFSVEAGRPAFSRRDVWIADVDGTHARRLVPLAVDPVWSVRNWIAFSRGGQIFLIRPNGTRLHQLTRAGGESPTWSPHGTMLAFTRAAGVFVTGADGSGTRRVSRVGQQVAWSPDGRLLAMRIRNRGLAVIDLRTDRKTMLVLNETSPGSDLGVYGGIDWQPLPRR